MKILKLRFKNLNSLFGEWEIDFTHPSYVSDGIFAITGPTGAGKTTILDAICLALYGRTPRLDVISTSSNEIMSRQTGECFAELTFETQSGKYRSFWSQRRAFKKVNEKLQNPMHEIARADTGELLASGIRGVATLVESVTGMDFGRFTRSIMLAQGGFAVFLQAPPNERAPILEQITGTEIYSQISIRVHERLKEEKDKLKLLNAEALGIMILDPEEEEKLGEALKEKEEEELGLNTQYAESQKALSWLSGIEALKKETENLAKEEKKIESDVEAFKPEEEKLKRAISAASLDGVYSALSLRRKQQADDCAKLIAEEGGIAQLESGTKEKAEALSFAEGQSSSAKEELKSASKILQKVRSLDQQLDAQKNTILDLENDSQNDSTKLNANKNALCEEQEKLAKASTEFEKASAFQKVHERDEWLITNLAGVEEQFNGLLNKQNELKQKEADKEKAFKALRLAEKDLDKSKKQSDIQKEELKKIEEELSQKRTDLSELLDGRLLREYQTEKENLLREKAYLTRIVELEEYRVMLEDGKPCPLCGSNSHPFAEGNVPEPDATEQKISAISKIIGQAEELSAVIEKLNEAEKRAAKNVAEAEKLDYAGENNVKACQKGLIDSEEGIKKLQDDYSKQVEVISAKLKPLGIEGFVDVNISSLSKTLKERMKAWQDNANKISAIEKEINKIESDIKSKEELVKELSASLEKKLERISSLKENFKSQSDERYALFGNKNPDTEEERLNNAIAKAEAKEKLLREEHRELQNNWSNAKTRIASLKERIDKQKKELSELELNFYSALMPLGFADEEQFLSAILPQEQRSELTLKAKSLDDRQTDLKARQKDRENRLRAETAKRITDKTLEELEPQFKQAEESLKELREKIAGMKHKLNENEEGKERIKEKHLAIEARQKECSNWEKLHHLIGSSDGKKYRNFAQGLTFEVMIAHANKQLQNMTERYLLVRNENEHLELSVIDNYQAGEIRSTKNLSGGESFIVSLALALGLSQMASKNVRVDSLFLDEGFGTLDEDALDSALETLSSLQQDGKLIGVISHVPALKERISTQIQLISKSGGRSILTGPACKKIQ